MDRILYTLTIEYIMYAMLCMRSDVSYGLSIISRYQANPSEKYWIIVKNILKYLRRTEDMFLIYERLELVIQGYTDSSF